MVFHPYPQLIPPVFNLGGFGPPHALTRASTWPWVDHPASGPERATTLALFGLVLATATPHGLTSRHATNSQAHSSKGTPPPPHTTSMEGSDGLQAPGFRYYFTPLPGYFSPFPHGTDPLSVTRKYLDLPGGPGRFTRDSTSPVLLGTNATRSEQFQLRDSHPLRSAFPDHSPTILNITPTAGQNCHDASHNPHDATPDRYHTPQV